MGQLGPPMGLMGPRIKIQTENMKGFTNNFRKIINLHNFFEFLLCAPIIFRNAMQEILHGGREQNCSPQMRLQIPLEDSQFVNTIVS